MSEAPLCTSVSNWYESKLRLPTGSRQRGTPDSSGKNGGYLLCDDEEDEDEEDDDIAEDAEGGAGGGLGHSSPSITIRTGGTAPKDSGAVKKLDRMIKFNLM